MRCCVVQCGSVWFSVVQCGAVWCSDVQCGVHFGPEVLDVSGYIMGLAPLVPDPPLDLLNLGEAK